jgi:HD-GYP domain-containing protein (c-di-GMP phosphodiesterase class II)
MAVADAFTAITEDRPYRRGMEPKKALSLLERMGDNKALDQDIISIIRRHFDEVNEVRMAAQAAVRDEYSEFEIPVSMAA